MMPWTPEDDASLATYLVEVTQTLLPSGTQMWREGDEVRFEHADGLSINLKGLGWYFHARDPRSAGGISAITYLRQLMGWSREDAVQWGKAWLAAHPGVSSTISAADPADPEALSPATKAVAEHHLEHAGAIIGSGVSYFQSRALPIPSATDPVRYLEYPAERSGEHSVIGVLTSPSLGRVTGIQCLYIVPDGSKSLVKPVRRRFNLEPARDAVFVIPPPPGPPDSDVDLVLTEGLENALSVATMGRRFPIWGLPGIGVLQNLTIARGTRVVVFRDGDAPKSAADKALQRGLDHLLLNPGVRHAS